MWRFKPGDLVRYNDVPFYSDQNSTNKHQWILRTQLGMVVEQREKVKSRQLSQNRYAVLFGTVIVYNLDEWRLTKVRDKTK